MAERRPTLGEMVAEARSVFSDAGLSEPAADARTLIAGALKLSATDVITKADGFLDDKDVSLIRDAIQRRCLGEPVHRILGFREFYGLILHLSKETLEPRPDTEILVDEVLFHVRKNVAENGRARILDLGTGTGAICLAILSECPGSEGVGVDISGDALATARRNAAEHGLASRFRAIESDWFSTVEGRFDLIISNPPYIPSQEIESLARDVREFDPLLALDGGVDGLIPYRIIANEAGRYLEPGGIVAVETGWNQHAGIGAIFEQAGFDIVRSRKDYGGNDRVLIFALRPVSDAGDAK